jgi:hypothetical protein
MKRSKGKWIPGLTWPTLRRATGDELLRKSEFGDRAPDTLNDLAPTVAPEALNSWMGIVDSLRELVCLESVPGPAHLPGCREPGFRRAGPMVPACDPPPCERKGGRPPRLSRGGTRGLTVPGI